MGEKGWVYTVQFQDAGGMTHQFTPAWNGGQPQEVGKRVAVCYLPADPAGTAQRADGMEPHLPAMLLGVGAVCIVASPLALVL
jgi:hypothetical protein